MYLISKQRVLLGLIVLLMASLSVNAQDKKWDEFPYPQVTDDDYSDWIKKKFQDQQDKFLDKKYAYPAKPKDKWEVGLHTGMLHINGDVKPGTPIPGWGFGGSIRKSLGYIFSVRGSFMTGTTYGQNWQPTQGHWVEDTRNLALTGGFNYDEWNDEFGTPVYNQNELTYFNYKNQMSELVLSGMVNINNLKFHRRRNWFNWYGYAGAGGVVYNVSMNQLDADGNEYDYNTMYANLQAEQEIADGKNLEWVVRDEALAALETLMDDTYESQAERHLDDFGDGFLPGNTADTKPTNYQPTVHAGTAFAFKISKMINLAIESKITITRDDLLDGQRWTEWGALTRDFDTYSYNRIGLNINLGGKNAVEPLWWMSPLDYAYNNLNKELEMPEVDIPDLEDDDGDGVPNYLDREPNTPPDCGVDTHGVMLDSDGDGVPDCKDDEPFSSYDCIGDVDKDGVCPVKPAADCIDCPSVAAPSAPVVNNYNTTQACDWFLPMIHFDLNKDNIKSEFYPHLHHVATALKKCPGKQVVVSGHTDTRADNEYNRNLSCRRASNAIDYLVTNYGFDRSQFILSYGGEEANIVPGAKSDKEHYINRRVEFTMSDGSVIDLGGCTTGSQSYDSNNYGSGGTYYGSGNSDAIFIDK